MMKRTVVITGLLLTGLAGPAACGDDDGGGGGVAGDAGGGDGGCTVDTSYDPIIDPARFTATVDNRFFPLVPGTVFTYDAPGEHIVTTVESETRVVDGVECTVVHDVSTDPDSGETLEDTFDWFAQDQDGAVWYFGEDTTAFEGGTSSKAGSWEAGVGGAKPGVQIPAEPMVGDTYRQEYAPCEAEDMGEVLALDATATVPAGSFTGCLETHDFTPLEPAVNERKDYCPDVGLVLTTDVPTGEREELIEIQPP